MTDHNIAVHHLFFLAPVQFYCEYIKRSTVLFEACEHYQKRSHRNRYVLNSSQGRLELSIPLRKGKNQQCPIRDVQISYDEPWHVRHFQTIRSTYGKSAFFEYYGDGIEKILHKKHSFLFDLNLEALEWTFQVIGIQAKIQLTHEYQQEYQDPVTDFRTSASSVKTACSLPVPKPYAQPWQDKLGFVGELSILDVLFCCGPESAMVLRSGANQ